jgi:integrase
MSTLTPTRPRREDRPLKDTSYADVTTLGRRVEFYLDYKLHDQGCQPRTIEGYRYPLAAMCKARPDFEAEQFTLDDLRDVLTRLCPERSRPFWTPVFRDFWGWMEDEGYVQTSPARRLRTPKRRREIRSQTFTDAEVAALEGLPLRDGALMTLLFSTGIRMTEARELRTLHADLEEGELTVVRGKGGKGRIVGLTERCVQRIADLTITEGLNPTEHLWYGYGRGSRKFGEARGVRRTNPVSDDRFYRWWTACLEDAGVAYRNPHQARHTYASRWLRKGGSLSVLSEEMGHESIATTKDLYGHLDRKDKKAELRRLERLGAF